MELDSLHGMLPHHRRKTTPHQIHPFVHFEEEVYQELITISYQIVLAKARIFWNNHFDNRTRKDKVSNDEFIHTSVKCRVFNRIYLVLFIHDS